MFWLVENSEQFKEFCYKGYKEAFVEVIPYNNFQHPIQNSISAIYVRPVKEHKGYILPIVHTECNQLFEDEVFLFIKGLEKIYVRDKKEFLHYFPLKQVLDITLTSPTYIQYTPAHTFLYNKYPSKVDINTIVPIVKHYEYCEAIFEELEHLIYEPINEFYNHKASWVFYGIEMAGLYVDIPLYNDYFNEITEPYVYTSYNIKTTTTRPSNTFGGINYAALNKENGCRKAFIARNSQLIELDISAYHPTLAASLINYDFGDRDIHESFASMYKVDYQKAKELTFKQLYGGVFEQYKDLPFFKATSEYIRKNWETFNNTGKLVCPISNHVYYKDKLENMNPQKLFNYVLQNLETATNVNILWDIFKILKNKQTKLVLYTYDAFLFDFDDSEPEVLESIKQVFNKYKLRIKIKHGDTYDF